MCNLIFGPEGLDSRRLSLGTYFLFLRHQPRQGKSRVTIEVVPSSIVPAGGPRVCVAGCVLYIPQVRPIVETQGDEGIARHDEYPVHIQAALMLSRSLCVVL